MACPAGFCTVQCRRSCRLCPVPSGCSTPRRSRSGVVPTESARGVNRPGAWRDVVIDDQRHFEAMPGPRHAGMILARVSGLASRPDLGRADPARSII
jgi:hypothetical protein